MRILFNTDIQQSDRDEIKRRLEGTIKMYMEYYEDFDGTILKNRYRGKRLFTYEEVENILDNFADYYDIYNSDKFIYKHFSNCQDAPSDRKYAQAVKEELQSFIY